MGGCATKPKELEADAEAPALVDEPSAESDPKVHDDGGKVESRGGEKLVGGAEEEEEKKAAAAEEERGRQEQQQQKDDNRPRSLGLLFKEDEERKGSAETNEKAPVETILPLPEQGKAETEEQPKAENPAKESGPKTVESEDPSDPTQEEQFHVKEDPITEESEPKTAVESEAFKNPVTVGQQPHKMENPEEESELESESRALEAEVPEQENPAPDAGVTPGKIPTQEELPGHASGVASENMVVSEESAEVVVEAGKKPEPEISVREAGETAENDKVAPEDTSADAAQEAAAEAEAAVVEKTAEAESPSEAKKPEISKTKESEASEKDKAVVKDSSTQEDAAAVAGKREVN